jgi:hypothetical protein
MSNEMNDNVAGGTDIENIVKGEYAVILLQGHNSFGDMIYSYVEVTLPNIKRLYAALNSGEDFTPSDFGTIVHAGKGTPPESVRNEMAAKHNMLQDIPSAVFPANSANAPMQKKAWNEF